MASVISIDALGPGDRDAMLAIDQSAFALDARNLDPESDTAFFEWDRAWGARSDGALAAIYVVFSFGITVPARLPGPAAVIPAAGLSWVAVHPDHRRRGLLSAMIRHHLEDVHESGRAEAVSCLFASETAIYGRYGYGLSTDCVRLTLPAKSALRALPGPGDVKTRFENLDRAQHDDVIQVVYDAACLLRPGHTIRSKAHWTRQLDDRPSRRPAGAENLKILVAERHGRPIGYAVLRRTPSWGQHGPEGKVTVSDFQAVDPQSAYALWRRVLDFDLMEEVTTPLLAPDDPLVVWAGECAPIAQPVQGLWTRLVDVGAALRARGYAVDVDVVLDVSDQLCPWNSGRWRLAADTDGATCDRTTAAADLSLDVRELGSAYLGGTTFAGLGAAGLVQELTKGALAACSLAWRSNLMPATPYMF